MKLYYADSTTLPVTPQNLTTVVAPVLNRNKDNLPPRLTASLTQPLTIDPWTRTTTRNVLFSSLMATVREQLNVNADPSSATWRHNQKAR